MLGFFKHIGWVIKNLYERPKHLLEFNFTMTDNFRDSASSVQLQVYDEELNSYTDLVGGPSDTFQNISGTSYIVRTYYPANGINTKFRLIGYMANGDSIPSATFSYTPTLVKTKYETLSEQPTGEIT